MKTTIDETDFTTSTPAAAATPPSGAVESGRLPISGDKPARSGAAAHIQEGTHLCVFWIGAECYALDVAFVSEAVTIPGVRSVPGTPRELLGMHNLRGTALAVADLADVLELPRTEFNRPSAREQMTVLILSPTLMHAGLRIGRVDSIVPYPVDQVCAINAKTDHPAVSGVLKLQERGGEGVTILNGHYLLEKLKAIRDSLRRKSAARGQE